MKKFHPLAQLLVLVGITLLTFVFVTLLTVAATIVLPGIDMQAPQTMRASQAAMQILVFLLPAWIYNRMTGMFRFYEREESAKYGAALLAIVSIVVTLLATPAVDWLTQWNDSLHLGDRWSTLEERLRNMSQMSTQLIEQMLGMSGWLNFILNIIVVALLPAICEEMLFRGAIQSTLLKWWKNPHTAIIVTAAIFSLAHGDIFGFLPRFALGILLGYLFFETGSMWSNMAAHFTNNALMVTLYFLNNEGVILLNPSEPLEVPALATACCLLAASALFIIYIVGNKRRKNR